jgi:hypothetical protein
VTAGQADGALARRPHWPAAAAEVAGAAVRGTHCILLIAAVGGGSWADRAGDFGPGRSERPVGADEAWRLVRMPLPQAGTKEGSRLV